MCPEVARIWLALFLPALLAAQAGAPLTSSAVRTPGEEAREWRESHERQILDEFFELLRLPNTGPDSTEMLRNAQFVSRMLARRGVQTQLLEVPNSPPAVFGEMTVPEARQTLIFYAHYDGQPVEAGKWYTDSPFRPVLMSRPLQQGGQPIPLPSPGWPSDPEWRIYARSAADNKAPILAIAAALDALRARRVPIRSNLKFLIEGAGAGDRPRFESLVRRHQSLLRADLWLLCDGTLDHTGLPQVAFGARGYAGLDLTLYGARRELPTSVYSNWSPNPAAQLASLLASMQDDSGHVLIERFYEDVVPLSPAEKQALAAIPGQDDVLRREQWVPETEGGSRRLEEAFTIPSLNVHGFSAGTLDVRPAKTIPALARASLDLRLVKGMDQKTTVDRVLDHIRKRGFYVTEVEPGEDVRLANPKVCKVRVLPGFNPFRTSMDLEISRRVLAALERDRGPLVKLPTLGSSLPFAPIQELLRAPAIIVPLANHDSNPDTHNENLSLSNLWDGIETMAVLIALDAAPGC